MKVKKIMQILPAIGWYAWFGKSGTCGDMDFYPEELECFAVCEMEDGSTVVKGMVGEHGNFYFCSDISRVCTSIKFNKIIRKGGKIYVEDN